MKDEELGGFEEGLSATRVSTIHGFHRKGQILIGFACVNTFRKCNLGLSSCQTIGLYIRLEFHTKDSELLSGYNYFNMSRNADGEEIVSAV